ncbi:MAG: c-type cytochrome [Polyangiaceae bacterium]
MYDARWLLLSSVALSAVLAGSCGDSSGAPPSTNTSLLPSASVIASVSNAPPPVTTPAPPPAGRAKPTVTQGSAVATTLGGDRVLVADEDHEVVFIASPKLDDPAAVRVVPMPGPPAQIVALDGVLLVTIRTVPTDASRAARDAIRGPVPEAANVKAFVPTDTPPKKEQLKRTAQAPKLDPTIVRQSKGGLLVAFARDEAKGLVEIGRVDVAPDAWGVSVDPNGTRGIVSSPWAAEVAVIDVTDPKAMKVVAKLPTAREPRAIAVSREGTTAWVSHLAGSALTRIDDLGGTPRASAQPLPAAPERGPAGHALAASLGYGLALSPDGKILFAPRHAIGAEGNASWWGAPTVDVMDTSTGESLQPVRANGAPVATAHPSAMQDPPEWGALEGQAPAPSLELVQPRAVVYWKKNDALLVVSEGSDAVTEVDALAPSPALAIIDVFKLGRAYAKYGDFPASGGAPAGIALSPDESAMYVFCRSTFDLARIDLESKTETWLHLAEDALPPAAARGRALFYVARPGILSGGLGCASCHPEGRDDGYTWREGKLDVSGGAGNGERFVALRANIKHEFFSAQRGTTEHIPLYPRQTPMIAGRLRANGPYAWHGEDKDMLERLMKGSNLHRGGWEKGISIDVGQGIAMIDYLIEYGRAGLLPPPTLARDLTDQEKHGKELFESNRTGCAGCHKPEREMTDRSIPTLNPLPTLPGFDDEENHAFKTPSLWFLAGSAPYFHDGSAATLEALIENNGARMGTTGGLSPDDRDALVAYLRTL